MFLIFCVKLIQKGLQRQSRKKFVLTTFFHLFSDSGCIVGPRSVHTRDGWCLVGTGRLQKGTTASTFRKGAKSKSRERSGLSRKENKHVLERQEHEAEGDNAVRGVGVHAVEVDDNEVHNDGVREEAVVEVDDNGFGDEP